MVLVVAQLTKRLLLTTEILGSNPVNGKTYLLPTVFKTMKINKNETVKVSILKQH